MGRFAIRLPVVVMVIAALSSTLGSAAPAPPSRTVATPRLLAASTPVDQVDPRPPRILQGPPSPGPSPIPPLPAAFARPRPTMRPIPTPAIDAQEVALVNLDTGRFLWQSNARAAWAPASLTKIFTAMVAVDLMGMNTMVTVPDSIRQLPAGSTFMGLTPGERVTVRELLYGVFLDSGNDAAETLPSAATSRETFIADMNAKAARLGLRTTHFVNPTGLDSPGPLSSAAHLSIASIYLESHYPSL